MPKILPIVEIFKHYGSIKPLSLKGLEIHQVDGFASNEQETTLMYKPYFLRISSDDENINDSILGINEHFCFFFKTLEETESFYVNFLIMLTTNFFACEI